MQIIAFQTFFCPMVNSVPFGLATLNISQQFGFKICWWKPLPARFFLSIRVQNTRIRSLVFLAVVFVALFQQNWVISWPHFTFTSRKWAIQASVFIHEDIQKSPFHQKPTALQKPTVETKSFTWSSWLTCCSQIQKERGSPKKSVVVCRVFEILNSQERFQGVSKNVPFSYFGSESSVVQFYTSNERVHIQEAKIL